MQEINHGSETMNKTEENLSGQVWKQADLLARVDNDQELLRDLVNISKEEFPQMMRSLGSAVAAVDLKNAARLSHTLKGMLSSLDGVRAAADELTRRQLFAALDPSSDAWPRSNPAPVSRARLPTVCKYLQCSKTTADS